MDKLIALLAATVLAIAGIWYYNTQTPSARLRHATQAALDDFATALATKDRAKVAAMLKDRLTDGAHVHLEVTFFSLSQGNSKPDVQEFDKASLLSFIDNILYSLSDYSFNGELKDFKLSSDRKTASVSFTVNAWGDGNAYYSGTAVNTRFVTNTACQGNVAFDNQHALLDKMDCRLTLHSSPKAGEARKLNNPEAIQQMLK